MDVRAVAPPIACVDADAFAEVFFDQRLKRGASAGKTEAGEGDVGGLQRAGERTDVVAIRRVDMLLVQLGLPEIMGFLGLSNALGGQMCICPSGGAIAIQLRPVALLKERETR